MLRGVELGTVEKANSLTSLVVFTLDSLRNKLRCSPKALINEYFSLRSMYVLPSSETLGLKFAAIEAATLREVGSALLGTAYS